MTEREIVNLLRGYGFPHPRDGALRIVKHWEGFWFKDKEGNQRFVGYDDNIKFVDYIKED